MKTLPFARPSIDEETIAEVVAVLRSGWLTGGPKVLEFESALSAYCGNRPVLSCNSGTSALSIALRLLGIGPGDEVITTPLSWVATANVVSELGARPVFVDVDPVTRNIDINKISAALTPRTRALMPVDLAGLPVDRHALAEIATTHNLKIIEDAAQSFGASHCGTPIGSFGNYVAFSFHANKNLTTGEGGALVLPTEQEKTKAEQIRLQGVIRGNDGSTDVINLGMKANMTDIAASIGLGQLRKLDEITRHRRHLASCYFESMPRDLGVELPLPDFENTNWHMFQILLPSAFPRQKFIAAMKDQGIIVGIHYPAIHLFTYYKRAGYCSGDFPQAEDISARIVTLPLFLEMTEEDVIRVCQACRQALFTANPQ